MIFYLVIRYYVIGWYVINVSVGFYGVIVLFGFIIGRLASRIEEYSDCVYFYYSLKIVL